MKVGSVKQILRPMYFGEAFCIMTTVFLIDILSSLVISASNTIENCFVRLIDIEEEIL